MSSNRFKDHIKTKNKEVKSDAKQRAELSKYLRKLSTDGKGTMPKTIFSEDEASAIREFIIVMAKNAFPGSTSLKLEARRPEAILDFNQMKEGSFDYRYTYKIINLLKWKTIWSGQGYPIGILTEHSVLFPELDTISLVYLCSDIRIRCQRSQPIFKAKQSCASGYGTLPQLDKLKFEFSSGFFIDSNDEPIRKIFEQQPINDLLTYIVETNLIRESYK